jgi:hypothetical protein
MLEGPRHDVCLLYHGIETNVELLPLVRWSTVDVFLDIMLVWSPLMLESSIEWFKIRWQCITKLISNDQLGQH